jgi:prepilin-type N-terminal cleavage/methylation domain-containing protein
MTSGRGHHPNDEGFTLVELLVVIIVLGVLATITVLAVRGITEQGEVSAQATDKRTLVTAEEAHLTLHDTYATEAVLVSAGLLSEPSEQHDIDVEAGGVGYRIVPEGTGTTVPSTTPVTTPVTTPATTPTVPPGPTPLQPVTVAGFDGVAFGSGPNRIVIISDGVSFAGGWNTVSAGTPLPTTEIVWLGAGDVRTGADVEAIIATNPTYIVAAASVPITNPNTYVGQYLDNRPGNLDFWWGHQQGGLMLMIEHYIDVIVPGG